MKRSGKFYSRNEKETLKFLGFKPMPMSGAGWIEKEDGENELALVQLKSTDASSYRLDMLDMKKLEYHAQESQKIPIFLVQFLKQDKIYAIIDITYLSELSEAIDTGEKPNKVIRVSDCDTSEVSRVTVRSSKSSREQFHKERESKYGKRKYH